MTPRLVLAGKRCSFCGKSNDQVKLLIAGPNGVHICEACVDASAEIVAHHRSGGTAEDIRRMREAMRWPDPSS